jgi:SNF2 family DNA or RNA helicase
LRSSGSANITVDRVADEKRRGTQRRTSLDSYLRLRRTAVGAARFLLLRYDADKRLYPFQKDGVVWLLKQSRCILGDDMGLGKSAQVIVAARTLLASGDAKSILIVCPKTLCANWERELDLWGGGLASETITPGKAIRERVWRSLWPNIPVCITTYEQLRAAPVDLVSSEIDLLVADEAHRLRNAGSETVQAFRTLQPKRFWALTGTPVERDARDAATMLSLLHPARYSPRDEKRPIAALRAALRDAMLRRRKQDVLSQLPDVLDLKQYVDLNNVQTAAYEAALSAYRAASESATFLALIGQLREICDADPKSGTSTKLDRAVELLESIRDVGEKAVVFSITLRPLALLNERLARHGWRSKWLLTGAQDASERRGIVEEFKAASGSAVLIASMRVASEGLTLTEANHVLFINQWWNPSTNAQARDRVVRIGQHRAVSVYSFVTRSTVEELVERILRDKADLISNLVDSAFDTMLVAEIGKDVAITHPGRSEP